MHGLLKRSFMVIGSSRLDLRPRIPRPIHPRLDLVDLARPLALLRNSRPSGPERPASTLRIDQAAIVHTRSEPGGRNGCKRTQNPLISRTLRAHGLQLAAPNERSRRPEDFKLIRFSMPLLQLRPVGKPTGAEGAAQHNVRGGHASNRASLREINKPYPHCPVNNVRFFCTVSFIRPHFRLSCCRWTHFVPPPVG